MRDMRNRDPNASLVHFKRAPETSPFANITVQRSSLRKTIWTRYGDGNLAIIIATS